MNPVGLGVAAGAATVAIALTNPVVGLIGGAVYLATVAFDALRRSRKKSPAFEGIPGMKPVDEIKDETTRNAVKKIITNKAALQRVLDDTPPDLLMLRQLRAHCLGPGDRLIRANAVCASDIPSASPPISLLQTTEGCR